MKNLLKNKDTVLNANGLSVVFEYQEASENGDTAGRLKAYKDCMEEIKKA